MILEWKDIRPVLLRMSGVPPWVREIVDVDGELPPVGVTLEEEPIDTSYVEFLQEQIKLTPRGEDWNQLLEARKRAFEKHVGETLVRVAVRNNAAGFVARLAQPALDVVHVEIF